jgi:hypothetical protein
MRFLSETAGWFWISIRSRPGDRDANWIPMKTHHEKYREKIHSKVTINVREHKMDRIRAAGDRAMDTTAQELKAHAKK